MCGCTKNRGSFTRGLRAARSQGLTPTEARRLELQKALAKRNQQLQSGGMTGQRRALEMKRRQLIELRQRALAKQNKAAIS